VLDKQRNLQGVVTVEISLDEKGDVIEAKGSTGPKTLRAAAEDAARRTKFKPALLEGRPIKSSGFINYNFVVQ
jgi:TonB family protein